MKWILMPDISLDVDNMHDIKEKTVYYRRKLKDDCCKKTLHGSVIGINNR